MPNLVCRGVRGAITVEENSKSQILLATRQMLALMMRQNSIQAIDLASAIFTVTKDLDAEFPAVAARQLGWIDVPLMCGYEISVEGSLPLCIRVLLHWNTDVPQDKIHHVYLRDAAALRPDLCKLPPLDDAELEAWIAENLQS
ncbi:Chorismate mutase AroH [Rosistilla oblonga]|uniref:chorismate mutase n=2 Tax=Rosistilla TaxID=2795779 RepID=A0A518IUU2_9BACT|nr:MULTISPECIES: chorismate mutase [Rosistilla]QDS90417.1 Chorismate mutase AroH [Rosistilla ulvae]QDV14999.1 Chorismate mutase AroH [Rosistilla oblonga]QDV56852.1 Chorismate mutase AroH [Rosistilla oblonga]